HDAGGTSWWVVVLQVPMKLLRRHGVVRLHEIALRRVSCRCRMLQAMSSCHCKRENLVDPKAAPPRNTDPQRGNYYENPQQHPPLITTARPWRMISQQNRRLAPIFSEFVHRHVSYHPGQ